MKKDKEFYKNYLRYKKERASVDVEVHNYRAGKYQSLSRKYDIGRMERFRNTSTEVRGGLFAGSFFALVFLIPTLISIFLHVDGASAGFEHLMSNNISRMVLIVNIIMIISLVCLFIVNKKTSKALKEAKKELLAEQELID